MKTPLILLFIGVGCCFYAHAQSNRIPGYIITNQKDTVRGFIVDRNDNWAIKSIEFSSSESGEIQTYAISSIDAMYFDTYKALYLSRETKLDKKPSDVTRLEDDGKRNVVTEWILLHVLVSGNLSLYNYTDENKKLHYFIEKDGKIEELELVRYSKGGRLVQLPFYISKLQQLSNECQKNKNIDIPLKDKELIDFVTDYNTCNGRKSEQFVAEKGKGKPRFGLFVGAQNSTGNYQGINNLSFKSAAGKYKMGTGFFVGINVDLQPPRASNRARFGLQVAYQDFGTGTFSTKNEVGRSDFEISLSTIRLGPTFKYLFAPNKKFSPYFKAEIQGVLVASSKATRTNTDLFGRVSTGEFTKIGGIGGSSAISLGASILGHLNVELRYSPNFMPVKDNGGLLTVTSLELGIGYLFGK